MNASRPRMVTSWLNVLGLLSLMLAVMAGCGWGSGPSQSGQASSSGRTAADEEKADAKALKALGKRRWYDSAKGEYRPPKLSQDLDHPLRRTGTLAGPNGTNTTTGTGRGGGGGGGWNWPSGEVIGYIILITLGTALLGVGILLAATSLRHWLPGRRTRPLDHAPIAIDPTRVVDLPFEAQTEMQDPLAYARALMAQGKFDEAIIFIYGYMLLALDRAGKITLHRGKTNRMYLQELSGETQLRSMLTPVMVAFEDVFFGRHSIEPERFRRIWDQLDGFHRALAPSIAAAAPLEEGVPS